MKQKAIVTVTTKLVLEIDIPEDEPIKASDVDDYMCYIGYSWEPGEFHEDEVSVNETETEIIDWNVESVETIEDED